MTIPTLLGTGGHAASVTQEWLSADSYYSNVGLGRSAMMDTSFTTASYVSQVIRVPGTISYLSWGVSAAFGTTLTLALNKGSSASALAVSIGASTTGWVTDSSHNVSVSNGDALSFVTNVGADTTDYEGSFYCVSARFDADTGSAELLAAVGLSQISPTTTLQFVNFLGISGVPSTAEGDKQFKSLAAGTWQNMACSLESNAFNKNTTVTNRINNSNGSMAISIPASTSGSFEDQSGSDTVSGGDLLDYGFILGSSQPGSGSFMMVWIGAHFLASTTSLCMIGGSQGSTVSSLGTKYTSLFGGGAVDPSGSGGMPRATGLFPYALVGSKFTNYLIDPSPGNATFTLLINNLPSLLTASSGGTTGHFTDNSHTVSTTIGNTCANQIVVAPGSFVTYANAALLLDAS